jgi:type I restriction enzyme M protein
MPADHNYFANLIWQIADLLRGPYRPPQYERVMLPMTVLRRFDCVLAPTKSKVLVDYERSRGGKLGGEALDSKLNKAAGQRFHNHSPLDFEKLKGDPDNIDKHLVSYIKGFSTNVQRIFEYFEFEGEIEKMREANILYLVVSKFADVDLHPSHVPNEQMGLIFENLIRRFNELANETAGDHFTPREVIRLMVNLLFIHDDKLLSTAGTVRKLLDPACGTGGMLAEAQRYLRDHHSEAKLYVYGQDYNKRAFATAASDMLLKEVSHNGSGTNVRFGDSFTEDHFQGETFDYFLSNPPFGVDWKKQQDEIQKEHEKRGFDGRFGAGLPRVNDGALLFLQHMWSKREDVKPSEHKPGSRLAIVFSGSPMFTGGAGSGESDIRKWLIENDWLEAIVALPEQMFYNTGIGTYIWILTNRKERRRRGKIQLLDARDTWTSGGSEESSRSLGDKRRHLTEQQIQEIVRLYGSFADGVHSKVFDNAEFGYTRVTIERPLRLRYQMTTDDKARFLDACPHLLDDVQAIDKEIGRNPLMDWGTTWKEIETLLDKRTSRWRESEQKLFRSVFTQKDVSAEPVPKGGPDGGFEADANLRDFENVPLKEDANASFQREVLPHVPDAWLDRSKDKTGYEVNFSRYFDSGQSARALSEIDAELERSEHQVLGLLGEMTRRARATLAAGATRPRTVETGIPWIGAVPAHWQVVALRFLVDFVSGGTPNTSNREYWGGDIPWVSPKDMKQDEIGDAEDHVTQRALQDTTLRMVPPGAVLVVVRGMILAHSFPVAVTTAPVTINQDMKALLCRGRLAPKYLRAFLRGAEKHLVALADSSAHGTKKVETELLGRFSVCVPPLEEQHKIAGRIRSELDGLSALTAAAADVQTLLIERRAAVVAAATTGKLILGGVE